MTTIALDSDLTMASDSMMTGGGSEFHKDVQKIWNIENYLIGVAGSYGEALEFVNYLTECIATEQVAKMSSLILPQPMIDRLDQFEAIVVNPNGEVYLWEGSAFSIPACAPMAIGSGCEYAIAAMECGKTAPEAVEVAKKYDLYTGRTIVSIKQEEAPQPITKAELKRYSKDELIEMLSGVSEDE